MVYLTRMLKVTHCLADLVQSKQFIVARLSDDGYGIACCS